MRFSEFEKLLDKPEGLEAIEPFPELLNDFSRETKPLLWLRLVAYAAICNKYINTDGLAIGFEQRQLNVSELLRAGNNDEIVTKLDLYQRRCNDMSASPL
jgi:hypothetical protein